MKNVFLFLTILLTGFITLAQPPKKGTQTGPNNADMMKELQKIMSSLPPDQQALVRNVMANAGDVNKNTNPGTDKDFDNWEQEQIESEKSIGTTTTKIITAAGGSITSNNGKITLNFPPGALTKSTEIEIDEIKNMYSAAVGNAFDIKPTGLILAKPVQVTRKYSNKDLDGTSPEMIINLQQTKNGKPSIEKVILDKKTNKAKLSVKELCKFSDIAAARLRISPETYELGREQSVFFTLSDYVYDSQTAKFNENNPEGTGDPDVTLLTQDLTKVLKVTAWKLDGVAAPVKNNMGSLTTEAGNMAKYTAPKAIPLLKRWVTISVELVDVKSGTKFILHSNIFLNVRDFFHGKFGGKTIKALSGLDLQALPTIKNEIANKSGDVMMVQCNYTTTIEVHHPTLFIILGEPANPANFFTLRIINPHTGRNLIFADKKDDGAGVNAIMNSVLYDGVIEKIRKLNNGSCDIKPDVLHNFEINLTSLDLNDGGLVQGYFTGTLYSDKGQDACESSKEFDFSGEFSLTVVVPEKRMPAGPVKPPVRNTTPKPKPR